MKFLRQTLIASSLFLATSCAFWNSKTVDVSINSSPPGADIFIEGKNYGQTPATINIEPKKYSIVLTKEGYGSTTITTDVWWATARTDVNGVRTSEGTRCFLDMTSVIFSFNAYTGYCSDFKQKQYFATIPYLGSKGGISNGGNSMMGVGQRPADMVPYYYQGNQAPVAGAQGQQNNYNNYRR